MASLNIISCILILGTAASGMTPRKPEIPPIPRFDREVPVLLYSGGQSVIEINGSAALECYRGAKLSEVYYFSSEVQLAYSELGIEVRDQNGLLSTGLTEIRCKPRNELTVLTFSGRSYRGYLRGLYRDEIKGFILVNMVDIEEYLAGVLPGEIGERTLDEYEAAKAQAVAARTYAIWKLTYGGAGQMLFPTIADQVYLGRNAELDLLTKAVFETTGEIVAYGDKPIAAYYHAVCGGESIPVEKAWPDKEPAPYLQAEKDDNYCAWAKSYSWSETFEDSTLRNHLRVYFVDRQLASADDFREIKDVEFSVEKQSGRVMSMKVITGSGVFIVERDQIRWALGRPSVPGAILPSTMFTAEVSRTADGEIGLAIRGRGNGHGVGLCQCGAIGRARSGQKYDKILKSYYKGSRIEKIY